MAGYVRKRLLQAVLVLWGAFTLSFFLLYFLPSDAISIKLTAGGDNSLSPEQIAEIRAEYGYDRPAVLQYLDQLWKTVTGDLGRSLDSGATVTSLIASALPQTLLLSGIALVVGVAVGLVLGSIASHLPSERWREALLALPPLGISIPTFAVGLILIQVVSFQWRLVPSGGNKTWDSLVLPAITLSLPVIAIVTQVFAKSLDDVLRQGYIDTARGIGAGPARIHFHHAIRNAIGPTLSMAGVIGGGLLAGTVVVETVFSREGIGRLTVDAVTGQDLPVVQAVVLLSAATFVVINLVVDLLGPVLDRRVVFTRMSR
ncbi:ABC transporter permease [Rhodococcus sp. Eu-32]|uniref:ABC transporter permease n=1 Tax=Rhodococcus sp. Eu-32 TaxID=1017319 RepID=UPI000DF1CCE2|nr:ABC transporter permease [Rhodococcus sp. Eu-32]RRQ29417.1 ABC transporter permease [Rhodococcus sp. Eu-32]